MQDSPSGPDLIDALVNASTCSRLFIDGGSNMGEHVEAFFKGSFHRCAISSPHRLYSKAWFNATRKQQLQWMHPLSEPHTWCVRSFDPAPGFAARLQTSSAAAAARSSKVRYVDAALGVETAREAERTIIKYSNHSYGLTTGRVSHHDLHLTRPPVLASFVHRGPSIGVRDLIRRYRTSATTIALKLDVEAWEFDILPSLIAEPELLCSIDYMFTEYHNSKFNATKYGWPDRAYSNINDAIRLAMDTVPNCKLRINWRSFWSACGEPMRFVWSGSYQATNVNVSAKPKPKPKGRGRRGRRGRLARG